MTYEQIPVQTTPIQAETRYRVKHAPVTKPYILDDSRGGSTLVGLVCVERFGDTGSSLCGSGSSAG